MYVSDSLQNSENMLSRNVFLVESVHLNGLGEAEEMEDAFHVADVDLQVFSSNLINIEPTKKENEILKRQ